MLGRVLGREYQILCPVTSGTSLLQRYTVSFSWSPSIRPQMNTASTRETGKDEGAAFGRSTSGPAAVRKYPRNTAGYESGRNRGSHGGIEHSSFSMGQSSDVTQPSYSLNEDEFPALGAGPTLGRRKSSASSHASGADVVPPKESVQQVENKDRRKSSASGHASGPDVVPPKESEQQVEMKLSEAVIPVVQTEEVGELSHVGREENDLLRNSNVRKGWKQQMGMNQNGSVWKGKEPGVEVRERFQQQGSRNEDERIYSLGRTLTSILRHRATELGLVMRSDGYVAVEDILKLRMRTFSGLLLNSHSIDDVRKAVEKDNKQRFGVLSENGRLLIRANQGHSIKVVESTALLKPIDYAEQVPVCVHGTFLGNLKSIMKKGLSRMKRNHVHFASGLPNEGTVISGMRSQCEVLIYLDVAKALADGMKLYISENGVILTEGFDGIVPTKYFAQVVKWPERKVISNP